MWTAFQFPQIVAKLVQPVGFGRELECGEYGLMDLFGGPAPHGIAAVQEHLQLTSKGVQVALLFLFFHKRLGGPLAYSRFHHQPDPAHRPNSKLEVAYHKADKAIQDIVDLLAA